MYGLVRKRVCPQLQFFVIARNAVFPSLQVVKAVAQFPPCHCEEGESRRSNPEK
jgi:hypothetical protein